MCYLISCLGKTNILTLTENKRSLKMKEQLAKHGKDPINNLAEEFGLKKTLPYGM